MISSINVSHCALYGSRETGLRGFWAYEQINTEKEQENGEREKNRRTTKNVDDDRGEANTKTMIFSLYFCGRVIVQRHCYWNYTHTAVVRLLHFFCCSHFLLPCRTMLCHKCLATGWITSHSPNNRPQYIWLDCRLSFAKTPYLRVCVCVAELCAGLANIK